MLDPYGDIFDAGIPPQTAGTFALTGPGFTGTLPAEVTPIAMPLDFSSLIFRADKFSPAGEDQTKEAQAFRTSLKTQTLSDYVNNPSGGTKTKIVPEIFLAAPFKTTADDLIAHAPIAFLRQLQRAVESDKTPPFSPYEQALSNRFNSLFANRNVNRSEFSDGAQTAHELILDRYLTHTDWARLPRQTGSISPISVTGATRSSSGRRSPNSSSTPTTKTRRRIITYSRMPTASRSTGATRAAMS